MASQLRVSINQQLLAERVRKKRGDKTLRELEAEIGVSIAVLSRVERAKKLPDLVNFGVLCHWLGDDPTLFFIIDDHDTSDPLTVQLRAAKLMSAATAGAFADIIRAAYTQLLEQENAEQTV